MVGAQHGPPLTPRPNYNLLKDHSHPPNSPTFVTSVLDRFAQHCCKVYLSPEVNVLGCRKNLTALQRRSIQRTAGVLLLTVITNLFFPRVPNPLLDVFPGLGSFLARQHASWGLAGILSALSLLPVVLAVWIAAAYVKAEPDEFVRMLLVRALLWGFTVTMAGDAILGVLNMLYVRPFPGSLLNADLFIVGTVVAFRVLRWGYE